ncbi:MAG TPA: undecaprenyl-diphosphate phosphatase [Acidobacteriaceae bacterium]|nr:undecaprenyl-diphosphate phosphatase [Acidobacteriaceae bacterium]
MSLLKVIVLAVIQGLAELLPVSSSAHVVVAEKLMGMDPSAPAMTLLLVMLHTGTMFAVIVYFWKQWKQTFFSDGEAFKRFAWQAIIATFCTGVVGEVVIKIIEHTLFRGAPKAQIEDLFSHLEIVAPALLAAGILILVAGLKEGRRPDAQEAPEIGFGQAGIIGAVQGLCLPFRGFSRSGATISVGILQGIKKVRVEAFSFALAVIITPLAIGREVLRLRHADSTGFAHAAAPSLLGMVFSFAAGLLALKWLSAWLERGRWYLFGIYCIVASIVVFALHAKGY